MKRWTKSFELLDPRTCEECIEGEGVADLCLWCPALEVCSSGFGRLRQQWEEAGCHNEPLGACPADNEDMSGSELN